MIIRAKVIDVRSTDPTGAFAFFVDTNAWYWMTYTRASTKGLQAPVTHQLQQYSYFMKKALSAGASVYRCELSFAELAHRIEACEREIFSIYSAGKTQVRTKEFRGIAAERIKVVAEIESSWNQVKSMSESISLLVDDNATSEAMKLLKGCGVDGYDAFHIRALLHGRLNCVLTDDADFATIPDIAMLTCNVGLIKQAEKQGCLADGQKHFASKN